MYRENISLCKHEGKFLKFPKVKFYSKLNLRLTSNQSRNEISEGFNRLRNENKRRRLVQLGNHTNLACSNLILKFAVEY